MTYPLKFQHQQGLETKVHVSSGNLPAYIDPSQPPTKKSPWRQLSEPSFYQDVKIIMPEGMFSNVWNKIEREKKIVRYSKVFMKLQDVLEGDFFNNHVKRGNVLMLSEGRPGVDDVFSLQDGILRLQLDKDLYKRAGLQGNPVRSGARKHIKAMYLVEVELRSPSMLHGKKGFERLVWAAKNVLDQSKMWLFSDLDDQGITPTISSSIRLHQPTCIVVQPTESKVNDALVPTKVSRCKMDSISVHDEDQCFEIMEWLDLVSMKSPRIMAGDMIDPYLSRYRVPEEDRPDFNPQPQTLIVLYWKGLMSPQWLQTLLIAIM